MNLFNRVILSWILLGAARGFAANGPGAGYKLQEGADYTFVSPDKQLRVEQYAMVSKDDSWHWQFWVFDSKHKHRCLLNAKPMNDYSAGFRFSPDSQWLVRMQKTGAGWATLFLYRRNGLDFTEATKKPLGDMAWDYYANVRKALKMPQPDDHISADLVKGYDGNYRWLGYKWPEGRYLIIALTGNPMGRAFWCIYDTTTGKFFSPPDLEKKRAAAKKEK